MAINPNALYPAQTVAPDANYPYGSARNVTLPGDGTGTPWEEDLINDFWGFLQWLLNLGDVVPSGTPDTILATDYGDAIKRGLGVALEYDAAQEYIEGSIVRVGDDFYRSQAAANTGNAPDADDGTWWLPMARRRIFDDSTANGTAVNDFVAPITGIVYLTGVAAGGAGGDGTDAGLGGSGGGGGGGAAVVRRPVSVTKGVTYAVSVGARGVATAGTAGADGGDGGDTTFGALLTLPGGKGGKGGAAGSASGDGGAGSAYPSATVANQDPQTWPGSKGNAGAAPAGSDGGAGGASYFWKGSDGATSLVAAAAGQKGSGGGGGNTSAVPTRRPGANGGEGFLIVEW